MSERVPVSVLMSVYNGERFLRESIDSILSQTFTDFEFIIVDDSSNDNSGEILQNYASIDPRIVLVFNDTNLGLTKSLNKGLEVARGEYIARMDADDVSLPGRLTCQAQYLDKHPDIGLVGTAVEVIDGSGKTIRSDMDSIVTEPGVIGWFLLFRSCLAHPSVMIRKSLLEQLEGYDPRFLLAQDHDLWLRASFETKISNIPKVLLKLRSHSRKISLKYDTVQRRNSNIAVQRAASRLLGEVVLLSTVRVMRWPDCARSHEDTLRSADLLERLYFAYIGFGELCDDERRKIRADASRRLSQLAVVCGKMSPLVSVLIWTRLLRIPPEHPLEWLRKIADRSIRYWFRPHPKRLQDLVLEQGRKEGAFSKRALISYVVRAFDVSEDDPRFFSHINVWHAREMVRVLNQMEYIVDVIDYRDIDFVSRRAYNLFIGHGGVNYETIVHQLPEESVKIYFSTGSYWRFHNEQELARFEALQQRRGVELPPDRLIKHSEERALKSADGIIGIGNDHTKTTYEGFSPIIMINGTALSDDHYERVNKNFDKGKSHFLYFAGGGNVHKGLDLLLEAFAVLEQQLWICTEIDPEFARVYSSELNKVTNIHLIGWIQSRSKEFYELTDKCNYVILPSCSEGQANSVIECMNQGLIPIVSRACGLNVKDYGFYIEPCTIEEIKRLARYLSCELSTGDCREMSLAARKAATVDFSESAFVNDLRGAIEMIISSKRRKVH